jgi:polyhydroxybutyrate depolymerase
VESHWTDAEAVDARGDKCDGLLAGVLPVPGKAVAAAVPRRSLTEHARRSGDRRKAVPRATARAGRLAQVGAGLAVALLAAGCTGTPARSSAGRPATPGVGAVGRSSNGSSSPGVAPLVDRPVPPSGCGRPPPGRPGTTVTLRLAVDPADAKGRASRSYLLHVPHGYRPAVRLPVVVFFHGHGGTAAAAEAGSGWSRQAERVPLLAVYPQGLPEGRAGPSFWANVGPADDGVDDGRFVSLLLDDVSRLVCVDPARVYASGMSNGGGMAGFLACNLAHRFAAIAPVAGNYYPPHVDCADETVPLPVLAVHGTADSSYRGISLPGIEPLPPVPVWLTEWVARDGCRAGPRTTRPASGLTVLAWAGCRAGSEVVHYRLDGAGHVLPATLAGRPTAQTLWSFFARHRLAAEQAGSP